MDKQRQPQPQRGIEVPPVTIDEARAPIIHLAAEQGLRKT